MVNKIYLAASGVLLLSSLVYLGLYYFAGLDAAPLRGAIVIAVLALVFGSWFASTRQRVGTEVALMVQAAAMVLLYLTPAGSILVQAICAAIWSALVLLHLWVLSRTAKSLGMSLVEVLHPANYEEETRIVSP